MGREIKRVPVDFDWPTNKVWPGYNFETPDCERTDCPDSKDSEVPWSKEAMCAFHQALWDGPYVSVDPPSGDGWQVWETVSEGSPISPVFATRDGLIAWLCSPDYSWGISTPLTREQAERFVDAKWAPSMVASSATGLIPGEQWVGGSA